MYEKRLKKLGSEKAKRLTENFDEICDIYREKADKEGFNGDLKFICDNNSVNIYVEFELIN
jgi:hypothetical protein